MVTVKETAQEVVHIWHPFRVFREDVWDVEVEGTRVVSASQHTGRTKDFKAPLLAHSPAGRCCYDLLCCQPHAHSEFRRQTAGYKHDEYSRM